MEIGDTTLVLSAFAALAGVSAFIVSLRRPEWLLGLHIASRVVLDGVQQLTYIKVVGGLSVMQLFSTGWIAVFLLYLLSQRADLRYRTVMLPILSILIVYAVGTLLFGSLASFAGDGIKWVYLYTLAAMTAFAVQRSGAKAVYTLVLVATGCAVLNQFFFALVQPPKCNKGVCSFLGSYYHEAGLSSILMLFMISAVYLFFVARTNFTRIVFGAVAFVGLVSVFMAGYRTAWAATAVLLAIVVLFTFNRSSIPLRAAAVILVMLLGTAFAFSSGPEKFYGYYSDVAALAAEPGRYFDFKDANVPREAFSGRLYLFSVIMSAYLQAPIEARIVGMGLGSIAAIAGVYAHNEFLSALVEGGVLGLIAFVAFICIAMRSAASGLLQRDPVGVVGFATMVSVCVLSLATMPFHDIRAVIMTAIVIGVGLGQRSRSSEPNAQKVPTSAHSQVLERRLAELATPAHVRVRPLTGLQVPSRPRSV